MAQPSSNEVTKDDAAFDTESALKPRLSRAVRGRRPTMSSFTKGWRPIASVPTRATYRLRASHISMYRDLRKERSRRRTLTGHSQVSRPSRRCIGQFGSIQVSTRCTSAHVPQHPCQRVTGWRMGRDWPMPAVTGRSAMRQPLNIIPPKMSPSCQIVKIPAGRKTKKQPQRHTTQKSTRWRAWQAPLSSPTYPPIPPLTPPRGSPSSVSPRFLS